MKISILIMVLFSLISFACSQPDRTNKVTTEKNNISKEYKPNEPIEFYDVINMVLPEETSIDNYFNIKILEDLKAIKRETEGNHIELSINEQKESKYWKIFSKDKRGDEFNWFSICFVYRVSDKKGNQEDCEKNMRLESFFPNKNYTSKLLKNEGCSKGYGLTSYEVKFPEKKPFIVSLDYNSGIGMGEFGNLFFELEMIIKPI